MFRFMLAKVFGPMRLFDVSNQSIKRPTTTKKSRQLSKDFSIPRLLCSKIFFFRRFDWGNNFWSNEKQYFPIIIPELLLYVNWTPQFVGWIQNFFCRLYRFLKEKFFEEKRNLQFFFVPRIQPRYGGGGLQNTILRILHIEASFFSFSFQTCESGMQNGISFCERQLETRKMWRNSLKPFLLLAKKKKKIL